MVACFTVSTPVTGSRVIVFDGLVTIRHSHLRFLSTLQRGFLTWWKHHLTGFYNDSEITDNHVNRMISMKSLSTKMFIQNEYFINCQRKFVCLQNYSLQFETRTQKESEHSIEHQSDSLPTFLSGVSEAAVVLRSLRITICIYKIKVKDSAKT